MFRCCTEHADRLSIVDVAFLQASEWLHVLRGHDLRRVTVLIDLPLLTECRRRGFNAAWVLVLCPATRLHNSYSKWARALVNCSHAPPLWDFDI